MHKLLTPANGSQLLYKVEDNGIVITEVTALEILNDNTVANRSPITIQTGNYIRLTTPIAADSKLLVLYDIQSENIDFELMMKMAQDIAILKEAMKDRISKTELDLYIDQLTLFKS